MIEPGKQHNLRVLRDATWTEDFNRLLAVSGLSANRLLNHLIQTGISTLDVTGQKSRIAIVTTEELNHLLERRAKGPSTEPVAQVRQTEPVPEPIPQPVVEPEPEPQASTRRKPQIERKRRQDVKVGGDVLDTFRQYQTD